ncbi:MAG TPA: hypothetical protein P5330_08480 [Candidatus Competibacteraceae bacterium]|nr:hypothetical protein [Candidatus Competibacteraceae bacterium]
MANELKDLYRLPIKERLQTVGLQADAGDGIEQQVQRHAVVQQRRPHWRKQAERRVGKLWSARFTTALD